ncbi:MAG: FtsQ-type POTRA domain-containing protein [Candidatus Firestonebacteria bacterium]
MNKVMFYSKYRSGKEVKLKSHSHNFEIKGKGDIRFKKIFKTVVWLTGLILIVLGLKGGYDYLYDSPGFNLKNIKITGNKYISKNEVLALTRIENGKNIFKINIKDIEKGIKINAQIKEVEVNRIFPSTIEINVKEREPVAYIGEDKLYQVDKECVVFPSIKSYFYGKKVFVLVGFNMNPNDLGRKGDNVILRQSLQMIDEINKMNSPFLNEIARIDVNELEELTLINEGLNQRFKIGLGNWEEKLEKLINVLKNLNDKRQNIAYVDLRFRDEASVMFK